MIGSGIFGSCSRKRLLVPNHLHKSLMYAARSHRRLTIHGRHLHSLLYTRTAHALLLGGHFISPRQPTKRFDQFATMSTLLHFERIDPSYLVEEETVSGYNPKHYYPVKLEEVLHERYKVIGKLGFGSASTVWLCRDLQEQHEYVALKVYINNSKYHREVPIYEEINKLQTAHEGRKYIRKMYDSFELQGPHGTHICLVHQPLGISLGELKPLTPDGVFEPDLVRQTMRCILTGLQFLHKEVRVIHTGKGTLNSLAHVLATSTYTWKRKIFSLRTCCLGSTMNLC